MAISATMEILGTKMWDMAPDLLHYHKQMIDNAILLRAQFEKGEEEDGMPNLMSMADSFSEKVFVGKSTQIRYWDEFGWESGDAVISVTPIVGPIIRQGDACSYGSKNFRDAMMAAADVPGCVGHLIYMDSPGGSAYAKNDFKYAFDYIRSKGQPIIGLIDGLCASACEAVAAMCDEVYFVNATDRVGSIGTMCAFYATQDGVVNAVTQDRFVEVYGSKSEWKNKEYRDAAVGNYDELQKEVDELNEQFWETIKTYRPQVLEEQMHGKIYNCGDVIGTLVDGQGTMQSCINRILELAGVQTGAASGSEDGESASGASGNEERKREEVLEPVQEIDYAPQQSVEETIQEINKPEDETTNEPVVPGSSEEVPASQNKERKMKEYPLIMSALGLNVLAVDKEGGYYMNEALCDAMEAFVAQANQNKLTMDAKIEEVALLNVKIEELKNEHEQAIKGLNEAHAQEIENLNAEHQDAVQALTEQKDGEIAELNNKVIEAQATIDGLNEQMVSKDAEINELSGAVVEPQVPQAPTADGVQTVETTQFENISVINGEMTPDEKKSALSNRMAELEKMRG